MLFASILLLFYAFRINEVNAEFHQQHIYRREFLMNAANWRDSWGDGCDWYEKFDPMCSSELVTCCTNDGLTAKTVCPHCLNIDEKESTKKGRT